MAELDERLIDAVRAYPCLYNSRSGDFKVSLMKENAWKAVAASLERSIEDVQKRWKTLREHFVRETKKKKKPTGSAAKTTPQWALYDHLLFLKDFVKHRNTVGNAPQQDCEGSDMEDEHSDAHSDAQSLTAEESKESTPSASSDTREYHYERKRGVKRKCVTPADEVDLQILQNLKEMQQNVSEEEELFGKSVAASIRNMPPEQRAMAKIRIQQVLYDIQFQSPSAPYPYYPTQAEC